MLQLANNYNPQKDYQTSNWLVSPKLDGVRCIYLPSRGLISRSQKVTYVGFDAIESYCNLVCSEKNLTFIDGELYIPGEQFDVISGIVRKSKNYDPVQKARVEFRVFAIGTDPHQRAGLMADKLEGYFPQSNDRVKAIYQKIIFNSPLSVQQELEDTRNSGRSSEGIMLRNPNSVYAAGRSNDLLKVKNFTRSTLICTGFVKGKGKYAGSLGAIEVQLASDRRVTARVGTGFTDVERQNIWANQVSFLGRELEGIYLGITPGGKLRHPVFVSFRDA